MAVVMGFFLICFLFYLLIHLYFIIFVKKNENYEKNIFTFYTTKCIMCVL